VLGARDAAPLSGHESVGRQRLDFRATGAAELGQIDGRLAPRARPIDVQQRYRRTAQIEPPRLLIRRLAPVHVSLGGRGLNG
jgi:hypothetical protein